MKTILLVSAFAFLAMASSAYAQEFQYAPYPRDFEQLTPEMQNNALLQAKENSTKYFHSEAYRNAINQFVKINNPADIASCKLLRLGREKDRNKTSVVTPLLFAHADDIHPSVGEWEQDVIVTGCRREFAFTMHGKADNGRTPVMLLKR